RQVFAFILAIIAVLVLVGFFFLVPFSPSIVVPSQAGPRGNTTIHTSLSCQTLGIGEASFSGSEYNGNQWLGACENTSHIIIPNPRHINGTE
ncbi:MAG TPA: hypothetical protein VED17_08315, partial [Nitrososphaerales archaeon]|nr:hypothetical protein [Nitrososphaerales archaeon]